MRAIALSLLLVMPANAVTVRLWYCYAAAIEIETAEETPSTAGDEGGLTPQSDSPAVVLKGGDKSTDEEPGADAPETPIVSPEKMSALPVSLPRLVYSTRAGCEPCRKFWAEYQSGGRLKKYIDTNFVLEKRIKKVGPVPTFEVEGLESEGYRSSSELLEWLKGRKEKHEKLHQDPASAARRNIKRHRLRCGVVPATQGQSSRSTV